MIIFASVFYEFLLLFFLPFLIWVISWWGFISVKLGLGGDAFYYYWDSRFFLDNISHGVYPLWNPDYSGGVSWNFFLRRMGEVNPFYWIINGQRFLGISPLHAHLIFLVSYYFLGLLGFWLLARLFLKNRLTSTAAYLLLLFSWGGQIFYCFDVLMFVPLVWFFYFVFSFAAQQKKHQFLGACFAAALMVATYIPFFTLTVIASFFFFFFLFYMKESWGFFKDTLDFISTHKRFAALSLVFFLLACAPDIDFYFESRAGGFVMPSRHLGSTDASAVAVSVNPSSNVGGIGAPRIVWDIIAHGYFDKVFAHQDQMGVGDFNIAYLFFIVLLLSVINPVSRRSSVLLLTAVFITLIGMTKGRMYPFLLGHVFFFRYMRMLQLFFWLAVLPMAILMAMEQLRVFLKHHQGRGDIKVLVYVVIVHVLFLAGLLTQQGVLWSSYLAVGLSLVFFILAVMGRGNPVALALLLWLGLIIQPVTFAHRIEHNTGEWQGAYINDRMSMYQGHFLLPHKSSVVPVSDEGLRTGGPQMSTAEYYDNPWLSNIRQAVNEDDIKRFVANKLLLYDNSMPEDSDNFYEKLVRNWDTLQNVVYLPLEASKAEDFHFETSADKKAQVAYEGVLKVLSFDVNTLRLRTDFDRPRFLLWANGYHTGWHVYIDGREGRLLRADYAFKGAWVPAGDHTVEFRFGTRLRFAQLYGLMFAFIFVLAMVVSLGLMEGFLLEKEVSHGF